MTRQDVRIVLASASPRRLDLLRRIGLAPEVAPADVDERLLPGEAPDAAAGRLAGLKADAACRLLEPGPALVIAADTIVAIDGRSLGKPADAAEAAAMLERLSGRTHEVHTGFVVAGAAGAAAGRRVASVVTTRVRVKRLSRAEIDGYVATGEPFGKAGAYAIQGAGAFMVTAVEGSVTNVIGLPLAEVLEALVALGGPGAFGSRG
ncbi:MAG TPA: Maf family protein [Thermodesulfobacteriota bacterium]